jgi:hypothetical protein
METKINYTSFSNHDNRNNELTLGNEIMFRILINDLPSFVVIDQNTIHNYKYIQSSNTDISDITSFLGNLSNIYKINVRHALYEIDVETLKNRKIMCYDFVTRGNIYMDGHNVGSKFEVHSVTDDINLIL